MTIDLNKAIGWNDSFSGDKSCAAETSHPEDLADLMPASFAQERLWLLDQIRPGIPYNTSYPCRLSGPLDVDCLEQAINAVIRRHEALRTTFAMTDGQLTQVIAPHLTVRLRIRDISSEEWPEQAAMRLAVEDAKSTFDLATGPLIRNTLLRLGQEAHVLVVTMHHIVVDGWSLGVLNRELGELYAAYTRKCTPLLPDLPIQYADFAVWQREYLQGDTLERQLSYWRNRLGDLPPSLDLPLDYPRPARPSFRGAALEMQLSDPLSRGLELLSREWNSTLFMTLMAAFQALLARYTGQDDIVIGTPIANRTRAEIEPLIGFFVNTLALRTDLSGDPTFLELLERVRETCLGAYAHQDLPFEKLVAEVNPDRQMDRNPLFQVMFSAQSQPGITADTPGTAGSSKLPENEEDTRLLWTDFRLGPEFDLGESRFDIEWYVWLCPDNTIRLEVNYCVDLFHSDTIRQMMRHYVSLLTAVVSDPCSTISKLCLLEDLEKQEILAELNSDRATTSPQTIVDLWNAQVVEIPDSIAVIMEGRSVSYRVLDSLAESLALRLRDSGVGIEHRVGILLERSIDAVVVILAIVKTGACYVPIDPNYPNERIHFILRDSDVCAVVTSDAWTGRCEGITCPVLFVDRDTEDAHRTNTSTTSSPALLPENLAYVMYTSGSTGTPKGIAIPHAGVVRLVHAPDYLTIERDDTFFQYAPLSFDASTLEIWGSLLNGATLIIPPPGRFSLAEIGEMIASAGVTVLWLTSGLFHLMVEHELASLRRVRILLTGGDIVSPEHARRFQDACPQTTLICGYGPTENTTFTTCFRVPASFNPAGFASLPIGNPIRGSRVYILDSRQEMVPRGVIGELYAAGRGLGRHYLGRPALTAEMFMPDPYGNAGDRMYRTGDIVRLRRDGAIEFLGRQDTQIKLRGFRIELGEIEEAIRKYSDIKDAVVLVREHALGDKRLVAFVSAPHNTRDEDVRLHLASRIPAYMMPSHIVVLPDLPLTAHGKVNRLALEALPLAASSEARTLHAPETEVQKALAAIWEELLALPVPSIDDDFFANGGHSLIAIQMITRVRDRYRIDLPLISLFENPTIRRLSAVIDSKLQALPLSERRKSVLEDGNREEAPLSFAQERLWFLDVLVPNNPFYNVPVVYRILGTLDLTALERAFNTILARHSALRTTFTYRSDGHPYQTISPQATITLSLIDLQGEETDQDAAMVRHATAEARLPFDIKTDVLIRALVLRLSEDNHILLITMHHIVCDGWSLGVLNRELGELYAAYTQKRTPLLPDLPIQYADFAVWQREYLQGDTLERQLSYWRNRLDDLPPAELPADFARPEVPSYLGESQRVHLPAEICARLAALCCEQGVTYFMVLLTAFQILLSRYMDQDDIVIGTPIANRTRTEIEPLIGFFVNTLALRTDLSGDPTFLELLERVRETCLGAYAHQDLPFEKLVAEVNPDRHMDHNPFFDIVFAVQNAPMDNPPLGDLKCEILNFLPLTTRFDLEIHIWQDAAELSVVALYATDLFSDPTIVRMLAHYAFLIETIVRDPKRPISHYSLHDNDQRM